MENTVPVLDSPIEQPASTFETTVVSEVPHLMFQTDFKDYTVTEGLLLIIAATCIIALFAKIFDL